VQQEYFDAQLRHQVGVIRLAGGEWKKALKVLEKSDRELARLLRRRLRAAIRSGSVNSPAFRRLLKDVGRLRRESVKDIKEIITQDALEIADVEIEHESRLLELAIIGLLLLKVPKKEIRSNILGKAFAGRKLTEWFGSIAAADQRRIRDAIQVGLTDGESVDNIVRRVIGTKAAAFRDGALLTTRHQVETVVRTVVNHTSNAARELLWAANPGAVNLLQWNSVLDGRTCFTAGHRVLLPDGDTATIESLNVGDTVVGGISGLPREVVAKKSSTSEVVQLCFEDGRSLVCTPDHLLMTERGWVEARECLGVCVCTHLPERETVRRSFLECEEENAGARNFRQADSQCNKEAWNAIGGDRLRAQDVQTGILEGSSADRGAFYCSSERLQPDFWGRRSNGSDGRVKKTVRPKVLKAVQDGPENEGACQSRSQNIRSEDKQSEQKVLCVRTRAQVYREPVQKRLAQKRNQVQPDAEKSRDEKENVSSRKEGVARPCSQGENEFRTGRETAVSERERPRLGKKKSSQVFRVYEEEVAGPCVSRKTAYCSRVVKIQDAGEKVVYDIEVYEDHSFVCEGFIVHNSAICRARDGKFAPAGSGSVPSGLPKLEPPGARPPALPGCRSSVIAILPGQLPKDETYGQWLKRQPAAFQDEILGKTKGRLFRNGGVTLEKFVGRRGNELTIDQLRAQLPEAFNKAGV